jgi:hypothetical protein
MDNMKEVRLGQNAYYMMSSQTIVQYAAIDGIVSTSEGTLIKQEKEIAGMEVCQWGTDNLLPIQQTRLVLSNHFAPGLLDIQTSFMSGQGPALFSKSVTDGFMKTGHAEGPEAATIKEWLRKTDAYQFVQEGAASLSYTWCLFVGYSFAYDGTLASIKAYDPTQCRRAKSGKSKRQGFAISADWAKVTTNGNEPIFLPELPKDLTQIRGGREYMALYKLKVPGQINYSWPSWWGASCWLEVSNQIPVFHSFGLKNGYNVKYHVMIPKEMLMPDEVPEGMTEQQAIDAQKEKIRTEMDESLSGKRNNNKTLITDYDMTLDGKPNPKVIITPINNQNPDGQYIQLDKQANLNFTAGFGIPPIFTGSDTGGRVGGSGSEFRAAVDFYLLYRMPRLRRLLLEPFRVAAIVNKWPSDWEIGIQDVDLTTLDQNPTGKQNTTSNAATQG